MARHAILPAAPTFMMDVVVDKGHIIASVVVQDLATVSLTEVYGLLVVADHIRVYQDTPGVIQAIIWLRAPFCPVLSPCAYDNDDMIKVLIRSVD